MLLDTPPTRRPRRSLRPATPSVSGPSRNGGEAYLGPAVVLEVSAAKRQVRVECGETRSPGGAWALWAVAGGVSLRPGDTALVATRGATIYVIGVLATVSAAPILTTSSGATVTTTGDASSEVVQVHSKKGHLVAEYHPHTGKTIVAVDGDLEFVSAKGGISMRAAKAITLIAERLETKVRTTVSSSENTYESVCQLKQVKAGRTRTLVKGTCLLQARDSFLRTTEDFKIDGRQIHLG